MRRILALLAFASLVICINAQKKDVTQFLGIPVDGGKTEMMQKIKSKGFRISPYDKDVLEGIFNGTKVNVYIGTNRDKVCRIMLCDVNTSDERAIQIRFNKLCDQFEKNPKYISLNDYRIPNNEDIGYEMLVNHKRYEAIFYQQSTDSDSVGLKEKVYPRLLEKYSREQLEKPTEEMLEEVQHIILEYLFEQSSKKSVWFMISSNLGKYYITMFYDNEYNRADGEDL